MKKYHVQVVVTKNITVTEKDWVEDEGRGEFNKEAAVTYAKGCLIEDLLNNPNRGTWKVEEIK